MRRARGSNGTRHSALWGKTSKGETRSSALWGKGGRGFALLALGIALLAPPAVQAAQGSSVKAYVSPGLLERAEASPGATFEVIVQGAPGRSSVAVAADVLAARGKAAGKGVGVRRQFRSVAGVAAELTGRQILVLARRPHIEAITTDAPVVLSGYASKQRWPYVAGFQALWNRPIAASAPTIAFVDSGIEASRTDFGGRVIAEVNLTSLSANSPGDGRGHGTFVAGIAAASGAEPGGSPGSKIVSIDVMDDNGMAMTRDVIAAADWILANKDRYDIRVANFSLHSSAWASVFFDPLDRAVERLWFAGVVVVAAAGNYGTEGGPSGVPYAPGNDPFVITVGAADIARSVSTNDDFAPSWSAYGYTLDGFAKPELAAPGRYMVGPVPVSSTLALERPTNVVRPGYMELSGTSFAAPVVAAAAAHVLAVHPEWTPDQVKGALMLTASPARNAAPGSLGVGVVDARRAVEVSSPPNPNAALNAFVIAGDDGGPVFDSASWAKVAQEDASWASASWASASWANASWANASWASASWANASWSSASWASAAWANASWASASWANASWASTTWADNADGDLSDDGEYIQPDELAALDVLLP